jgi:uncharacterized protein YbgA (DUF1722 family)/uncharacterized protein YbbK (DUF523 family)
MFPVPKVVVSKCLGFEHCRYNGDTINDRFIKKLSDFVEFVPVCPEVEIGLGIPRAPIRIAEVKGELFLYQPATEKIVTDDMQNFVKTFLGSLKDIDGFVLKNRSPSCGLSDVKIYQGLDKSASSKRGQGVFGSEVLQQFPYAAVEDEGRLKNFELREHFLIKLFTMARFREARAIGTMKELVAFQAHHKLLLLAYNETHFRNCGRIVANHEKLKPEAVYAQYQEELINVLQRKPRYTSIINTLYHAMGFVSDGLTKGEKNFLLNTIEEYRDERIPLSTVLHLIRSHAIRFNNAYVYDQVFMNPYPKELVEITDSGKGRNY